MSELSLDEILAMDGWHPMEELPDTDRKVRAVLEDGSGELLAFCDEIAQIPPTGKRIWWEYLPKRGFWPYPGFGAWRELTEERAKI